MDPDEEAKPTTAQSSSNPASVEVRRDPTRLTSSWKLGDGEAGGKAGADVGESEEGYASIFL